jgi:hypothetical protein
LIGFFGEVSNYDDTTAWRRQRTCRQPWAVRSCQTLVATTTRSGNVFVRGQLGPMEGSAIDGGRDTRWWY